ncbi:1-(5-phosphoribosyl)-5-[(5-phosphoribosylamino)methylideneamino]imidazole-4-carboxamide isomerase [Clostridium saccharobutylicum]|uniref:1-(5-phosphoribosyl)-5-[(5-phosphoribosylamino)methylideneamino] imidazole-4-carboxamide isomerase n=1 Tax=Clostridium saccharobutylicum DSM 13864 TaxID=1345695 RepID=U5MWT4_CLOSA|nr:1-(5-phosphoribosyl)-5-[(5-phosphoribosylamino)methylideneamino]imidazole-4-carboxamide isomerase [Clostridium saccharobutylicum]AGX44096.1 1-(5-phosphoribosyl)-5-[(5-phosphoribosylamino)methylideneamino] imidazole-4-carboxamide isomerase HisA [Clostridium saccharobutylicum DSM 13864]AQR91386.1 1-(5-phosphoribosyl)-5-[(5-phosphoribosylamino)methylideneamino] imidazole-4-carboxamide isomerase [Clostridium saccharobutylicum]AQS01290.1 1-(5-phosphoribosyl)-5-[(5-phosphoribosylamino)methylideneam
MIILPAIDIMDGKPVRLYQGDYDKKEIVAEDIFETAKSFERAGAKYLHLVDLDGAKNGSNQNHELVIKIAGMLNIPVELGGGIRSFETIKYLLDNGVSRVILGTIAIEDEELLTKAIEAYGEKVAVGIDCKDGKVYGRGWLAGSNLDYIDFARKMEKLGVKNIIVTDISKDGTLEGPNVEMLRKLKETVKIDITASGGIRDIENIKDLLEINLYGAITGKAIYAGTLSLEEAIKMSDKQA